MIRVLAPALPISAGAVEALGEAGSVRFRIGVSGPSTTELPAETSRVLPSSLVKMSASESPSSALRRLADEKTTREPSAAAASKLASHPFSSLSGQTPLEETRVVVAGKPPVSRA